MKALLLILLTSPTAFAADLIIGGQSVKPADPVADSTVGVFSPGPDDHSGSLCTGTLIRKDIALTAAHCITPGTKPVLIFNPNLRAPGAVHREAQGVAVNPKWRGAASRGMDQGDIALVKFDGRVPEGYHPVPAVMRDSAIRKGAKVTLAGYGISNAALRSGAGKLRKTQVAVLNNRPGKTEMIVDQTHGHGACHGDSGGPAFVRAGGRIALAGLTNRSYPDSAPDDCAHDAVYTKVPAYKSWIQQNEKRLEKGSPLKGRFHPARAHLRPVAAKAKRARAASGGRSYVRAGHRSARRSGAAPARRPHRR